MSGEYAILAKWYDRIGMAQFATRMTPRLLNFVQQNGWLGRRIMDMGCGTGVSIAWFAGHGYSVSGVDSSPEMLAQAHDRLDTGSLSAELIEGDIRNLDHDDRVDLVLALDVLNELDGLRELEAVIAHLEAMLSSQRFVIFDLYTIEGLTRLNGMPFVFEDEALVVYGQSSYDFERQILSQTYDLFLRLDGEQWQRQKATRVLRAYPLQGVVTLLRRHNFEIVGIVDTELTPVLSGRERVIVVAKKR